MKKLIAMLLALAVLSSLSVSAFAAKKPGSIRKNDNPVEENSSPKEEAPAPKEQEPEMFVFDWKESESAVKDINLDGRFVTFNEIDAKVWLPDLYEECELTEEDLEDGYIGYYMTEEPEDNGEYCIVDMVYWDAGCASAEEYRDALLEWGYDTAELVELNGYEAVMYSSEEDGYDYLAVALATESGNIFEVSVHPVSSEEYTAVAYIILSSVQPT